MLSEHSKKLILHKLIDSQTKEELSLVYLTENEAAIKNKGYATNHISKKYLVKNPPKTINAKS